ncbi:MAG: hypothetical protein AB2A00_23890, partial [Myxococcota bacterium]
ADDPLPLRTVASPTRIGSPYIVVVVIRSCAVAHRWPRADDPLPLRAIRPPTRIGSPYIVVVVSRSGAAAGPEAGRSVGGANVHHGSPSLHARAIVR